MHRSRDASSRRRARRRVFGRRRRLTPAAKPGCNGLLAFTSNRAEHALPEIYRIGLDGTRNDVSRSIGIDSGPAPSPDGSKVAFWSSVNGLVVADADGQNQRPLVPPGSTVIGDRDRTARRATPR